MESKDDYYRYIDYLQEQTLDQDWAPAFDASTWRSWRTNNLSRLQEMAKHTVGSDGPSLVARLEESVASFTSKTRFEMPMTTAIFEPLFEEVKKTAARLGIKPIRKVEIMTSTSSNASPAARPTTGDHVLFIGLGTSSFCNYWAKCISALVLAIPEVIGLKRISSVEEIEQVFRKDPTILILAARLSLYYAVFGTTLGFGEVQQPKRYLEYRLQLLHAMETFSVAHEYAHFVAEERLSQFSGSLDPAHSQQLEFFCDELGLAISRECGNIQNNYLSFTGIGALVFFRAIQLCESVRELLLDSAVNDFKTVRQRGDSGSHPPPEERILAMKAQTYGKTAPDQRGDVEQFVEEYDRILGAVATHVLGAVSSAMESKTEGSKCEG